MDRVQQALYNAIGYKKRTKRSKRERADRLGGQVEFWRQPPQTVTERVAGVAQQTDVERDVELVFNKLQEIWNDPAALQRLTDEERLKIEECLDEARLLHNSQVRDHAADARSTTNRFVDDGPWLRVINTLSLFSTNLALISGPTLISHVYEYFASGPEERQGVNIDRTAILIALSFVGVAAVSGRQLGSLLRRKLGGADELHRVHYDALDNRPDSAGTDIAGTWALQMRNATLLFGIQQLLNLAPVFADNTLAAGFKPLLAATSAAVGAEAWHAAGVAQTKAAYQIDHASELPNFPGNDRVLASGDYLRAITPWYERTTLKWKSIETLQQALTAAIAIVPLAAERFLFADSNRFVQQIGDSAGLIATLTTIAAIDYGVSYFANDPRKDSERYDQIRNDIFTEQVAASKMRQTERQLDRLAAKYEDLDPMSKDIDEKNKARTYRAVLELTTAGFHQNIEGNKSAKAIVDHLTNSIDDLIGEVRTAIGVSPMDSHVRLADPSIAAQEQMLETLQQLRSEIQIEPPGGLRDGQASGAARVISNTLCELVGDLLYLVTRGGGPSALNIEVDRAPEDAAPDRGQFSKDFLRKLEPLLAGIRVSLRKEDAAMIAGIYKNFSDLDPTDSRRGLLARQFAAGMVDGSVLANDLSDRLNVDGISDEHKAILGRDLNAMLPLLDTPTAIFKVMILAGQIESDEDDDEDEDEDEDEDDENLRKALSFLRGLDPEMKALDRVPGIDRLSAHRTRHPNASRQLADALSQGQFPPKALFAAMGKLRRAAETVDRHANSDDGGVEAGITVEEHLDNLTFAKITRLFGPDLERALAEEYGNGGDQRVDIRSVNTELFNDLRNMPRQQSNLLAYTMGSRAFVAESKERQINDGHHHDNNFSDAEGPLETMVPWMDHADVNRLSSGPILNDLGFPTPEKLYYPFTNEKAKSRPKDVPLALKYEALSPVDQPRVDPGLTGIDSGDTATSERDIKRIQAAFPWVQHVSAEENLAKKGVGRLLVAPPQLSGSEVLRMLRNYMVLGYALLLHCDAGGPYGETKNLGPLKQTLLQHFREVSGPASDPLASGTHRAFTKEAPPMDPMVTIAHWVGLSRDTYPAKDHLKQAHAIIKDPALDGKVGWDDSWSPCQSFMYKAQASMLKKMGVCHDTIHALENQGDIFGALELLIAGADFTNDRASKYPGLRLLAGVKTSGAKIMNRHFLSCDHTLQKCWEKDLAEEKNYRAVKRCMDEMEPDGIDLNNPFFFTTDTAEVGMRGSDTVAPGSNRCGPMLYRATVKFGNSLLPAYEIVGKQERQKNNLPNKYEKVSPSLRLDTYVDRHDNSNRRDRLLINTFDSLEKAETGDWNVSTRPPLAVDDVTEHTGAEVLRKQEEDCQRRVDKLSRFELKVRAFAARVRLDVPMMADYRDSRLEDGGRQPGDGGALLSELARLQALSVGADEARRKEIESHIDAIEMTIAKIRRNADGAADREKMVDAYHAEAERRLREARERLAEAKAARGHNAVEEEEVFSTLTEKERLQRIADEQANLSYHRNTFNTARDNQSSLVEDLRLDLKKKPSQKLTEARQSAIKSFQEIIDETWVDIVKIKVRLFKLGADDDRQVLEAEILKIKEAIEENGAEINETVDIPGGMYSLLVSDASMLRDLLADKETQLAAVEPALIVSRSEAKPRSDDDDVAVQAAILASLGCDTDAGADGVDLLVYQLGEARAFKSIAASKGQPTQSFDNTIKQILLDFAKKHGAAPAKAKAVIAKAVKPKEPLTNLSNRDWLRDDHISTDQDLIAEELRAANSALADVVHFVPPAVASFMRHTDAATASNARAEAGMDDQRYLIVPINDASAAQAMTGDSGSHWSLLVIDRSDPARPRAHHYDSMRGPRQLRAAENTARRLGFVGRVEQREMRQQSDVVSCGDFVVAATRALMRRLPPAGAARDDQLDMPNLHADRNGHMDRLRQLELAQQQAAE